MRQYGSPVLVALFAIGGLLLLIKIARSRNASRSPTMRRLTDLISISIPAILSFESGLIALLVSVLVVRTQLSLVSARSVGKNARLLVENRMKELTEGVLDIALWALPNSLSYALSRYLASRIEQRLRSNLQRALHREYLTGAKCYKVGSLNSVIDNPDHRLTNDTMMFSHELADFLPSVLNPIIDAATLCWHFAKGGRLLGPLSLFTYYGLMGLAHKVLFPDITTLNNEMQEKEGDLRTVHSQIVNHAEEVAFYRGELLERENCNKRLDSVIKRLFAMKTVKATTDFFEAVFLKYGATTAGYMACALGSLPALTAQKESSGELTQRYVGDLQLYLPLAQSIGKVMTMRRKVSLLLSYSNRVGAMRDAMSELTAPMCSSGEGDGVVVEIPRSTGIELSDVDVGTPTGIVLLHNICLVIHPGRHILITGCNGSGKSALVRTIGGLWRPLRGVVRRPPIGTGGVVVSPQKAYLPPGASLRELLIYPDSQDAATSKGVTDAELVSAIRDVGLSHLLEREGLDSKLDWHEALSGGERQRIAIARVLYWRPMFALLDECTNAIVQDDEVQLLLLLKRKGVTLVTVSHRQALRSIHDVFVALDGNGTFCVSQAS